MAAVGFELYVGMLDEAVRLLAGDAADEAAEPVRMDLPVDAYVPGDYVPYEAAKIEIHRRVAGAREVAQLIMLREELEDRFGPVPEPLDNLIRLQDARIKLGRAGRALASTSRGGAHGGRADRARLARGEGAARSACPRRSSSRAAAPCACGCPRSRPSASARSSRRPRRSSRRRPSQAPNSSSVRYPSPPLWHGSPLQNPCIAARPRRAVVRGRRSRPAATTSRRTPSPRSATRRSPRTSSTSGSRPPSRARPQGGHGGRAGPARLHEVRGRQEEGARARGPGQADRRRAQEAVQDRVRHAQARGHAVPDPGRVGPAGGREARHQGQRQGRRRSRSRTRRSRPSRPRRPTSSSSRPPA